MLSRNTRSDGREKASKISHINDHKLAHKYDINGLCNLKLETNIKSMNTRLLMVALLAITISSVNAQKLTQGSLDYLKLKETTIEVKWDISQTKFGSGQTIENYLSKEVSLEEWENEHLPSALKTFVSEINFKTKDNGLTFSLHDDAAPYEMIVAPQTLIKKTKSIVTYTIKDKGTGTAMAVFEKTVGATSPFSLLIDIFEVGGNELGDYLKKFKQAAVKNKDKIKTYLKDVKVLNYRFDYSEATVNGVDLQEYYTMSVEEALDDPEESFRKYTKKVEFAFILSANKNALIKKGYKLDNKEDLPFEVVICPLAMDEDAEHSVLGKIVEKATGEEITRMTVHAGDGRWNSFEKLFLEQLETSGKKLGEKIASILNNARGY